MVTVAETILAAIPDFAHDLCLVVNHVRRDVNYDYGMRAPIGVTRAVAMKDVVKDIPALYTLVRWVLFVEKDGEVRAAAERLWRAFPESRIH